MTFDPQIQDVIDIHVVNIPETYRILLSREWIKCLRGWSSINFTQLWLPWKGLNNQIKINAEPKLKTMITEYNAPNEIAFLHLNLGSYKVMVFDIIPTKISKDQDTKYYYKNETSLDALCSIVISFIFGHESVLI